MRKAIAIDFDGCLCVDAFPDIGAPNWPVIVRAKQEQDAGAGLILWTCREDKTLQDAVAACERWGLHFDAINESLPSWRAVYGNNPRKIGATEYWDDKAVTVCAQQNPLTLEELLEMEGRPVWVNPNTGRDEWVIVHWNIYDEIAGACLNCLRQSDYGKTWLAYRHATGEVQI